MLGAEMHVDPRVFLSRPQDLSLKASVNLADALNDAANGADRIVILSAYYGIDYIKTALAALPVRVRRNCSLTMVFGVEPVSRLAQAVDALRALQKKLVGLGFRSPSIRLFNKNAPFHTKLYYFKRSTQPIWFIGSANASPAINGERHELMLRLTGRHSVLGEYIDEVIQNSVVVEKAHREPFVVNDIRSFLLNGSLCYRPLSRVSFTFEACQINSEHRAVLKKSLAEASEVPHADPQTEGFGFSLANAVEQLTGERFAALTEVDRAVGRVKFRHMAVETIYGYWLPATYARYVEGKLGEVEAKSIKEMDRFAAKLKGAQQDRLDRELERHVEGLQAFFASHSVEIKPKLHFKKRFGDFVRARRRLLADEERLERMVRRLHIEQMPDIWNDEDAAQKFENSFFEDLALRFDAPRKSSIARVLEKELELSEVPGPDSLKVALVRRLKEGLPDSIWSDDDYRDDEG